MIRFPLSDTPGASIDGLMSTQMQEAAKNSKALSAAQLEEMIERHHEFLAGGGAGGKWQTLHAGGWIMAIYTGAKSNSGRQAEFKGCRFSRNNSMAAALLPYSNFCGAWAESVNFSDADLQGSILTDSYFDKALFAGANLQNTDFSRASLRGCSFVNADLRGADMENCDLTGADMRGIITDGSRWPGAILEEIIL